jgi:hypothetical protein
LVEATRDAIGDAFEVFIGPATRGEEGQFEAAPIWWTVDGLDG